MESRARVGLRWRAYEESKRRLRVGGCGSYGYIPKFGRVVAMATLYLSTLSHLLLRV